MIAYIGSTTQLIVEQSANLPILNSVKFQSSDVKADYEYYKGLKNAFHPEPETAEAKLSTSTQIVEDTLKKLNVEEKRSCGCSSSDPKKPFVSDLVNERIILPHADKTVSSENIGPAKPYETERRREVQAIDADAIPIQNVVCEKELVNYDSLDDDKTESQHQKYDSKTEKPKKKFRSKNKIKLAKHAKFSELLQQFVKIGVDLNRWDTMKDVSEIILSKDFNRDVKPHIDFLIENELPADQVGYFLTKNPYILVFTLENLKRRIDFYKSKNFSSHDIGRMICKAVFLLNIKTSVVDVRFKKFQDEIKLSDDEIRDVITRQPKLITFDFFKIKISHQTLVNEFQLAPKEIKMLFVSKPKLWLTDEDSIRNRLDYVHRHMGISKADIARSPEILLRRKFIIKQRHLFLKSINRADYNWPNENSVNLKDFIWCNDRDFCKTVAKTSVRDADKIAGNDQIQTKNISSTSDDKQYPDSFQPENSIGKSYSIEIVKDALKTLKVTKQKSENVSQNDIGMSVTEMLLREQNLSTESKKDPECPEIPTDSSNQIIKHKTRSTVPEQLIKPSFNFAPFVNHSKSLQQLIKLGVDLSHWETLRDVPEMILRKDFDRDFKPYIQFLIDKGVSSDDLGYYFTKNPFILKERLENLQIRINYFESKKFTPEAIGYMISKAPFLLNQKTSIIDERLGFYQKELKLNGDEVRSAITRQPKLLTWSFIKIKQMHYTTDKELGFSRDERKALFLAKPKLWLASRSHVLERFNYVHNVMAISHEDVTRFPEVLLSRLFRIKERHLYLKSLNRAQYDPTKENYVSLKELVAHDDLDFCKNVARTTTIQFNNFLKTLQIKT
uniref:Transcription termination factor 3, mitochondrial n=1 Tax=Strigamia maritima TaxID=126957 RepID=T1JPG1_STRMM